MWHPATQPRCPSKYRAISTRIRTHKSDNLLAWYVADCCRPKLCLYTVFRKAQYCWEKKIEKKRNQISGDSQKSQSQGHAKHAYCNTGTWGNAENSYEIWYRNALLAVTCRRPKVNQWGCGIRCGGSTSFICLMPIFPLCAYCVDTIVSTGVVRALITTFNCKVYFQYSESGANEEKNSSRNRYV